MSLTHSFQAQLKYSEGAGGHVDWVAFYRYWWPNLVRCDPVPGANRWQKGGVDRRIMLPGGNDVLVDEKMRRRDYNDCLIETWSVWRGSGDPQNKPGWTVDSDKICDYVAYLIPSQGLARLIPFELMRAAARRNFKGWQEQFRRVEAKNPGYVTLSLAIPWPELFRAIAAEMHGGATAKHMPAVMGAASQLSLFAEGARGEQSAAFAAAEKGAA